MQYTPTCTGPELCRRFLQRFIGHYDYECVVVGKTTRELRPKQHCGHFEDVSNAISWMKIFQFRFRFRWNVFSRVQSLKQKCHIEEIVVVGCTRSCNEHFVNFKMFPFQWLIICQYVFSCYQAALWMVFSVRPSVRLSVCHTFLTMFPSSYHHEIFRSYH